MILMLLSNSENYILISFLHFLYLLLNAPVAVITGICILPILASMIFLEEKSKFPFSVLFVPHAARLMLCLLENMKKYAVIVDEDYQAFNENCNITLDEIDLKIQALNKELEGIKNIALKNYDILDKLFELRHVDF